MDGRRPEGPDADWVHLPDPVSDAIKGLASRIGALERAVAEQTGGPLPDPSANGSAAEERAVHPPTGPNPAGGRS